MREQAQSSVAVDFRHIVIDYIDKLPPARDHLTLALLSSYGTQSVAYAKNLMNHLQQQVNMLATIALEDSCKPSEETAKEAAKLTAAIFKLSVCAMLSASSGGSGKVEAVKVLLGRNRFWVAGFGVCADVAFFVLQIAHKGDHPVLRNKASPWSHFPMELYHLARHCGKSCAEGIAAECPKDVVDRFDHIKMVLATEHVWHDDVSLDLLEMHADTASTDSSLASALSIMMPLKAFFCDVADICSQWVQRVLGVLVSGAKAAPGMKQVVLVEGFTIECLDAILQTSLHVLFSIKKGSLAVICSVAIYCALKAATHADLKHLNLFPLELIHMRTVVEAVRSEAPPGCCSAAVAELKQTCTEVYNQEIISCHKSRIRRWIDNQHRGKVGDGREHPEQQCSVPQHAADLHKAHGIHTREVPLQLPLRG